MAECECLTSCPFFHDQMKNMPATTDALKSLYCLGDNSKCARYLVFQALGKGKAPGDLFPNNVEQARIIILKG